MMFFCSFVLLFSSNLNDAYAVNVDFNANGNTDFHLYGKNGNNVNFGHGFFLDDGQTASLTLGKVKGEKIALGDYDGDNKCDVGIVGVGKKKNFVVWKYSGISQDSRLSKVNRFGSGKVRVLTGCDFNGNGKTDLAYIDRKTLYYKDFNGKQRQIKLPRANYKHVYCADVTGNGKDDFIGKKKGIGLLNGKIQKNVWGYDVVTSRSIVLIRNVSFGDKVQGSIIAHDINGDRKNEIGYVRKANDYSFLVFLNKLSLKNIETTRYIIPRNIKKIDRKFAINRGYFQDGVGFIYMGVDDNVYKYNLTTNKDTTFILSINTPDNIRKGSFARDINDFTITASSNNNNNNDNNNKSPNDNVNRVSCDITRGVGNGFLWKGRSESDGKSVALLPIHTKASICYVVAGNNSRSESMRNAGFANPHAGVLRQHWRANSFCTSFYRPSVLKCKVGSQWQCWNISDPCKSRIE
ncbi:MAG: hypothetical protein ACOX3T_07490 [Bdellovibrionota bacterium]